MNAHIPQSLQTQEELMQLSAVSTQVISPSTCRPIIAVVQDIATGLYRLTKTDIRIPEKHLFNLMSLNPKVGIDIPQPMMEEKKGKIKKWSGHQVLSTIIPEKVNIDMKKDDIYDEKKPKDSDENKNAYIKIQNGECLSGAFEKDVYQARSRGIVHQVFNEYGPEETRNLFDNTQQLICQWLVYHGFSVGVSDIVIDQKTDNVFKEIIQDMKRNAYDIINKVHSGQFENNSIMTNQEKFELTVNDILNSAVKLIGKKGLSQIDESKNRLMNMIKSKSKGSALNVAQMMGAVGQQNVDGRRIPYGFDNRTLPHYTKFDDGPEAHGFVENSFVKGLNPQEFYFHAMGGREGLIDTAVSSVTGDTPIIIIENGKGKQVNIGDWIDQHLEKNSDKIKHIEQHHMEYFAFDPNETKVIIPTCDENGKMSWGEMTAVTRHDTINGIYKLETESGRNIKVTGSKSVLVYRNGKIVQELTTNVKIDDLMPINQYLNDQSLVTQTYIDMEEYFSKKEYVYGTEFNKAVKCIKEAMEQPVVSDCPRLREAKRSRIRTGWWEKSNGTLFQVPYPDKAKLQRATVRSNTENIIDGAIYPYHAKRDACQFPDKLELNFENGAFIGLFIADGHADPHSGTVLITKENQSIIKWVQNWASKYKIKTHVSKDKKQKGYTTTTTLYSTLLERFITKLVGHGAKEKYFPQIAFTSPIEFVKGLISGYISGDGHISKRGDIEVGSISYKIIDGFGLLCSRIGVMGMRSFKRSEYSRGLNISDMYICRISAHWVEKFKENIYLIHDDKRLKLANFDLSRKISKDEKVVHDVFLDRITSIEKINDSIYPKVYDVTVPSTLNFGLGNGVITADTSETGYLQRKLIKAMEDCKVNYDGTVRNAGGNIIQFLYGEDGMDSTKIESQTIPTITKKMDEILQDTMFSPDFAELKYFILEETRMKLQSDNNLKQKLAQHVKDILDDRDFIIMDMFKGAKESSIMYPVHFQRIINIATTTQNKNGPPLLTDLEPGYILKRLDEVCELHVTKQQPANRLFSVLARCNLTPKKILLRHRLVRSTFDMVIEQIKHRFYDSLVSPSEMVGVIAAQSIGEPSTQLTLNSFHSAGISSASKSVRGVPRLKELLDMTKEIRTPIMEVMLKENIASDQDLSLKASKDMQIVRFKDVVRAVRVYFDPDDFNTNIPEDKPLIDLFKEFNMSSDIVSYLSPWLLRLEFDKTKMNEYNLDMVKIAQSLDKFYEDRIFCVNSDDNADEIVMRIKLRLSNESTKENFDTDDILTELRALEFQIMENFVIKGVANIERAEPKRITDGDTINVWDPLTKEFVQKKNYSKIITDGSNLQDIMSMDVVDATRTISNDVNEIYNILGIEAARTVLYNEIMEVLDSIYVNYRHVALLIDVMTNKGTILSVNRHGINRGDIGPLAKCSFEETTDKLVKAGMFSEYDKINGVAANVMLGQVAPAGTGDIGVFVDETLLPKATKEKILQDIAEDEQEGKDEENNVCVEENIETNIQVPSIDIGNSSYNPYNQPFIRKTNKVDIV